jgi:histidine triad (HIT) family protein
MSDSIFTRIIKGEIPCHKVYEDERVIAFLDIDPLTPGHTLVVPKRQIDRLWDLDDGLYAYLMSVVKRVAERQRQVLKPKRVGMAVEGFAVPHVHVHVFPLNEGLEHTISAHLKEKNTDEEPNHEALEDMANKLRF